MTTKIESPDCGNNQGKKHAQTLYDCVIVNLFSDDINCCYERLNASVIPQMELQFGYHINPRINRDADRITIPFEDEQDAADAFVTLEESLPELNVTLSDRAVRISLDGEGT